MPRAHPRQPKLKCPWVYVGNLNQSIEHDQIYAHFRVCGRVRDVKLRYSGGTTGNPELGFRYAVVRFWSRRVSYAALQLNKTCIHGFPEDRITVKPAIIALPQAEALSRALVSDLPIERRTAPGARAAVRAPIGIQKTVVWEPTVAQRAARAVAATFKGRSIVVGGIRFSMRTD
ncbi:hypothetical protein C8R47DRAFT_1226416 [Mycena vitilis]|nr:hypothetical protein C8R47DRAFT_1226416 [Mycena vitilis]